MKRFRFYAAALGAGMIAIGAPVLADTAGTSATVVALQFSYTCPRGGASTMDGSYDTVSGQVSITTKVTGCTMRNGDVQDGTTTVSGTLVPGSGKVVNIDLTTTESSTVTRNNAKVTHACTVTKKGTLDQGTHVFTGQNTSNCSVDGAVHDNDGLVGYLLRRAQLLSAPTATTNQ